LVTCYSSTRKQINKVGTGVISFDAMIADISSARIIFIGEDHTNIDHHRNQSDVIKALHEKGIPLFIGLEMFRKKEQENLDKWISGRMKEKDFIALFYENWGYEWGLYKDIFLYARAKKIPLVGLNVPKAITRKVGQKGFQSLTKEELSELPPGITCELDQRYMDFIKIIFAHKGENDKAFRNFCEAQVLWDQAMAWHLAQYLEKNPDRTVVVLAGTVHVWKYGIPRQLQKYANVYYKVILPDIPGNSGIITEEDADYLVLY
jgi:uncharacterized iron-regulated protein